MSLISEISAQLGKRSTHVRRVLRAAGMRAPYRDREAVLSVLEAHGWTLTNRPKTPKQPANAVVRMDKLMPAAVAKEGAEALMLDIHKYKRMRVKPWEAYLLLVHSLNGEE